MPWSTATETMRSMGQSGQQSVEKARFTGKRLIGLGEGFNVTGQSFMAIAMRK
jgi:hypothetical protein